MQLFLLGQICNLINFCSIVHGNIYLKYIRKCFLLLTQKSLKVSFCVKGTSVLFQFSRCKVSSQWLRMEIALAAIFPQIFTFYFLSLEFLYFLVRFVFIQNSLPPLRCLFTQHNFLFSSQLCLRMSKCKEILVKNEIYLPFIAVLENIALKMYF